VTLDPNCSEAGMAGLQGADRKFTRSVHSVYSQFTRPFKSGFDTVTGLEDYRDMSASLTMFEKEHEGRIKYSYFICSISSALVAYIGKDYFPESPINLHDKLTLWALASLTLCFGFALLQLFFFGKKMPATSLGVAPVTPTPSGSPRSFSTIWLNRSSVLLLIFVQTTTRQ
jgi:hypothetical protein